MSSKFKLLDALVQALEWAKELKQEHDDARRWARAWKALAREYWDYQKESLPSVMEQLKERDELAAQVEALRLALDEVRDILAPTRAGPFADIAGCLAERGFNIVEKALALALTPPAALAELEVRVRREERERCIQKAKWFYDRHGYFANNDPDDMANTASAATAGAIIDAIREAEHICPKCGGTNTHGPDGRGYVACQDCGYVFGQDKHEPDDA